MGAEGWLCPSCGRGVAPDQKTCDHGMMAALVPPLYAPNTQPKEERHYGCNACRQSGICMCVRPDRHPFTFSGSAG